MDNLINAITGLDAENFSVLLKIVQEEQYRRRQIERKQKFDEARILLDQLAEICYKYDLDVYINKDLVTDDLVHLNDDIQIACNGCR